MLRRMLSFLGRARSAGGARQRLWDAAIGELIGRVLTVVWRERRRNR